MTIGEIEYPPISALTPEQKDKVLALLLNHLGLRVERFEYQPGHITISLHQSHGQKP